MSPDIQEAVASSGGTASRAFERLYSFLVDESACSVAIRSGQIAFSLGDDLVAVAYPVDGALEVLLAVPLDPKDRILFDAVDYKWRSLPAGVTVRDARSVRAAIQRASNAVERVRSGEVIETPGESYARVQGEYDPAFKKSIRQRHKR